MLYFLEQKGSDNEVWMSLQKCATVPLNTVWLCVSLCYEVQASTLVFLMPLQCHSVQHLCLCVRERKRRACLTDSTTQPVTYHGSKDIGFVVNYLFFFFFFLINQITNLTNILSFLFRSLYHDRFFQSTAFFSLLSFSFR